MPGQQPVVQLPVGTVQPGAVMQSQMPPSQPAPVPMVTPQTQQYQWYQQVPSAVGSVAVSTPITQNTPMQGIFKYSGFRLGVECTITFFVTTLQAWLKK